MAKKSIFQRIYDKIKGYKNKFIFDLMGEIQDIVFSAFLKIGKNIIQLVEKKIEEVAKIENISGREKFNIVFKYTKSLCPSLKDSLIDTIVQNLFIRLKTKW